MSVSVLIPSMYRPEGLERTIRSIKETSDAVIYATVPVDAQASRDILEDYSIRHWVDIEDQRFVQRIQYMFDNTDEDWFLTGADDIVFRPGWFESAESMMGQYSIISFEDLCNPNLPGTNFLINRTYIQIVGGTFDNEPGLIFGPYQHNFCDNELVEVASRRGEFIKCGGIIEHFHPAHGKGEWDDTYHWATERFHEDGALFNARLNGFF